MAPAMQQANRAVSAWMDSLKTHYKKGEQTGGVVRWGLRGRERDTERPDRQKETDELRVRQTNIRKHNER